MVTSVDTLIANAESRSREALALASANLSGSAERLVELFDHPLSEDPSAQVNPDVPGDFVPASPPVLVAPELSTDGEPGALGDLDTIPDVLDGVSAVPVFSAQSPVIVTPTAPSQVRSFNEPAPELDLAVKFPDAPSMPTIDMMDLPLAPVIEMPDRPPQVGVFDKDSPVLDLAIQFPDAPAVLSSPFQDAPTVADREAPAAPSIFMPSFDAVAPTDAPEAPTGLDEKFMAAYREMAPTMFAQLDGQIDAMLVKYNPRFHEQMATLEGKLSTFMAGGTALTPAVETAIYERTRDKLSSEYRRSRDTVMKDAARRGLTLPDGATFNAINLARQGYSDNAARAAIDVAIKQAELEQQNVQFALGLSNQLRSTVMQAAISYHGNLIQLNGQAVQAAQAVLNALLEGYNAAVRAFTVKLDAYKADVGVYEARLRAVTTTVDLYRSQIAAMEALTQVDVAKVSAYRSKVDAMQSIAAIYRTQIEAIISRAQLEKLKLEGFASEVNAFQAKVQSQTAAWQGYTAAINGEEAKAKVYAAQLDGFKSVAEVANAQAAAYRTTVSALVERAGLQKLKVDSYSSKIQAFQAEVSANTAQWQGYRSAVDAGQAQVQAYKVQADVHSTLVQSRKSEIEGKAAQVQAVATRNKGRVDAYTATWSGYADKMRAEQARVGAVVDFQRTLIQEYGAANQAAIAAAQVKSDYYRVATQLAIERGKQEQLYLTEKARIRLDAAKAVSTVSVSAADVYGRMASSALSGMNTLVTKAAT